MACPAQVTEQLKIIRAGRLAETEKLLPVNPVHRMNGINLARTNYKLQFTCVDG